jgi:hypothetical protein
MELCHHRNIASSAALRNMVELVLKNPVTGANPTNGVRCACSVQISYHQQLSLYPHLGVYTGAYRTALGRIIEL